MIRDLLSEISKSFDIVVFLKLGVGCLLFIIFYKHFYVL
jgi:hypothetical protein